MAQSTPARMKDLFRPPRGLAKGIALKPKLWLATAVSVVLAVASAQAAPSLPSAPHVRGAIHVHAYRGGWGHHHGWGWGPWAWLGLGAGIVAGAIIADEAAIGIINNKTTSVRIIPVFGKNQGEEVEFGGLMGRAPIMAVNEYSSRDFIRRCGRFPAPVHSFKN